MTNSSRSFIVVGFLAVVVGTAYANALQAGFTFDDHLMIEGNVLLTRLDYLPTLLTSDYWAGRRAPSEAVPWRSGLYRPFVLATFWIDYAWVKLSPWGYHLVNILLHLVVTWLVYLVSCQVGLSREGSIVAAGLFAVHPLHTEAVTGIVGRAELLMACGILGALWFAGRARRGLSLVLFAMALLSKEQAVVLPVLLLLYEFCLAPGSSPQRSSLLGLLRRYGLYAGVLGAYLIVRHTVLGQFGVATPHFIDNPLAHSDAYIRVLNAVKVAGMYLWLCVWPARLSADYSYNAIPLVSSLTDPGALAAWLAWSLLLGLAGWSFLKGDRRVSFAIGFAAVTFLPTSNLILSIGTIMGERLFYLPSVGLCLLAGIGYERIASLSGIRGSRIEAHRRPSLSVQQPAFILWSVLAVVMIALTIRTIERNREWVSTETLMQSATKAFPSNAKVHSALGSLAVARADWVGARDHLQTAIGLFPEYTKTEVEINFNLGQMLLNTNDTMGAVKAFERAVALDPTSSQTLFNLGAAYVAAQRYGEAETALRDSIALNPAYPEAHSALSWVMIMLGRYEEALREADTALQLKPELREARLNRARALEGLGQGEQARSELLQEGGSVIEPGLLGKPRKK